MKKHILMACCYAFFGGVAAFAQTSVNPQTSNPTGSETNPLKRATLATGTLPGRTTNADATKTITCVDTLRYAQIKEQLLGTSAFYIFSVWQADGEAVAQTFLNSTSHTINAIEFYGGRSISSGAGNPTVTVRASVYSVDASYNPVALLGSGTLGVTGNDVDGYRRVMMSAPVTVTGNYAVVLDVVTTNGVIRFWTTDWVPSQTYDENFTRYKSNYYATSSGAWVSTTALTTGDPDNFPDGTSQFDALISPIVSYAINTSFTVSDASSCLGEEVVFTNTTTPAGNLANRMYNYQQFNLHFGEAPSDSTFAWVMETGSIVWQASHNYTYATTGAKTPTLVTNGGFWSACPDMATVPVTVNALPTVGAGTDASICQGASTTLTGTGADTYNWDNGLGAGATHSPSPSTTTTYTVTGTVTATGCQNTDQVTVTVTPLDNAGFAYSSNTLCTGGGNETPTVSTAGGTFSSSPAGLVINTSTGEIDMTSSADGTYTVTYTTAGTCPNASNQNLTITAAPDATFNYSAATYCSADADPSPSFGTGASAGTFSSTTGLVINAGTGAIDLSASTPGTYSVTNTIVASGACPADDETVSVTINQTPGAAVSGGGQLCGAGTIPVTVTLTGTGPWDISYSDGTNTTNVTAQATSPFMINATAGGTYTVTTVSANGCSAAGTGSATVTFFTNPTVTFGPIDAVCQEAAMVTLPAGSPAGGTFTGTGVSGTSFDPAIGAGTYSITYTYVDGNGCEGEASADITVNPTPAVTFGAIEDLCIYDAAITLVATPTGGTFTGPGVTGTSFDPATAGLGAHNVIYDYEDGNGCMATVLQSVVVGECLSVDENELENLVIMPNPAHDFIIVSYNGDEALTQLTLLSDDGKVVSTRVLSGTGFNEQIEVSSLAKGIYFVRLTGENNLITKKVIVQ